MIPSIDDIQAYKNKVSHIRDNIDFILLRSAERWVNELIIDEIQNKMRNANFSQKIWMNTKIMTSKIEEDKVIVTLQNYYFSESGFDVAIAREYGTKDHWIRPRFKQLLSWIQDGRRLFSKGHIVSGIKSLHIIRNVVNEKTPEVQQKMEEDVETWKTHTFAS